MELKEAMEKALEISKEQKFTVRIYKRNHQYENTTLTYLELGTYLTTNCKDIKRVDIRL